MICDPVVGTDFHITQLNQLSPIVVVVSFVNEGTSVKTIRMNFTLCVAG